MTIRQDVRDLAVALEDTYSSIGWSANDTDDLEKAIVEILEKQRNVIMDLIEERRQKVLTNPKDPSYTEHFAELICDIRSLQI